MIANTRKLESLRQVLRLTYGLVPIIAGLDKFLNLLTNWEQYLSPTIVRMLPVSSTTFMHVVGVIEIAAGIVVLAGFTTLGAYIVSAWLTLIALSLIQSGHNFDVAVRDLVMAIGAYSLGVLNEVLHEGRLRNATSVEEHLRASA